MPAVWTAMVIAAWEVRLLLRLSLSPSRAVGTVCAEQTGVRVLVGSPWARESRLLHVCARVASMTGGPAVALAAEL